MSARTDDSIRRCAGLLQSSIVETESGAQYVAHCPDRPLLLTFGGNAERRRKIGKHHEALSNSTQLDWRRGQRRQMRHHIIADRAEALADVVPDSHRRRVLST